MDQFDYSQDLLFGASDPRSFSYPLPQHIHQPSTSHYPHHQAHPQTWPPLALETMTHDAYHQQQQQQQQQQRQQQQHAPSHPSQQNHQQRQQAHPPTQYSPTSPSHHQQPLFQPQQQPSRPNSNHAHQPANPPTTGLDLDYASMLPADWQYQLQQAAAQQQPYQVPQNSMSGMGAFHTAAFGGQLQTSPVDYMPHAAAENYAVTAGMDAANFMSMAGPMESMNALVYPLNDYQNDATFAMAMNQAALNQQAVESANSSVPGSSPTNTLYEVQSASDNEGWNIVNFNQDSNRHSLDSFGTVSNPSQNLHIRTNSDASTSDGPDSADLSGSYEEIPPWPMSSPHDFHGSEWLEQQYVQRAHALPINANQHHTSPTSSLAVSPTTGVPTVYHSSGSSSTSPTSSGPLSPPVRRRKSPLEGKTTKAVIKKVPHSTRKDAPAEKKVGRRRGPLRQDQRQQAHEIRKLRACLRCKFLKKTCDKGMPCGGCRPSHARLWQVPCTRMDIKDIGYFMKDWKADYERHISLGFSVGNIKGFSAMEKTLYITHGYGHYLPINAREVFVRDDNCFSVDWVETVHDTPREFELNTAKLSAGMEGVSTSLLSEYLDRHVETGFESFVDDYFEGTKFLTEILKTAYRYYQREQTVSVRKALKLVLAYNLTLHVTMVEGLAEDETTGKIDDVESRFNGKVVAPVMINFQVKCALADMWRELQKDILEELSSLYSSVYSGDKLKNWPTIFMLAAILLAIWEEMQFDCHYRVPDENAVNQFCEDMERTPVGVIVGLFQAISTKLPGLGEWDTRKHGHLLNSNPAVCDALTEVRGHVNKYETYLKERSTAKFDRSDFDSLSNKFLSKLVIRAN